MKRRRGKLKDKYRRQGKSMPVMSKYAAKKAAQLAAENQEGKGDEKTSQG